MKKKLRAFAAGMLLAALMLVPQTAFAVECTLQGAGTQNDPYLIGTEADLINFRDVVNAEAHSYSSTGAYDGAYFALTADIALAESTVEGSFNSSNTSIGTTSTNAFYGNFDGRGHSVSGLDITASSNYVGLFGYVGGSNQKNAVSIANLGVSGTVNGTSAYYDIGGLVGNVGSNSSFAVTIENCVSGVEVTGAYAVGGIAGSVGSNTSVRNCLATGSVTGADKSTSTTNKQMGGIVGYCGGTTKGEISNCLFTGQIKPTAAALVASTTKTINQTVNGIAGYISGTSAQYPLTACYYVKQQTAGVLSFHCGGDGTDGAEVASRIVDATSEGFTWDSTVAALNGGATQAASAWQVNGNGQPSLLWQLGDDAAAFTVTFDPAPGAFGSDVETDEQGCLIQQVRAGENACAPADPTATSGTVFAGWYVDADDSGAYSEGDTLYDFNASVSADITLVARYNEYVADTFIGLGEEGAPAGTAADPFLISTEADLVNFAASVNGKRVVNGVWQDTESGAHDYAGLMVCLARDIELTSSFTPIGIGMNTTNNLATPVCFSGTFDGRGHTISGLRFSNASNPSIDTNIHGPQWYSALFGAVSDASVLNVVVKLDPAATFGVSTLASEASAGLIAQVVSGTNIVSCCGVKGDMGGGSAHISGLVGRVEAGVLSMDHCYHQGSVTTGNSGGGLVGAATATVKITSCYQAGEVASTNTSEYAARFFGQLVGTGQTFTVVNCAASSTEALAGGNATASTSGCLSGVGEWNAENVQAALGAQYFVYAEDAATPPEFGSQQAKASYVVSFSKGDDVAGALPSSGKFEAGATYTVPSSSLTRKGYVFAGWAFADASEDDPVLYGDGDTFVMPESNVALVAQWKLAPATEIATEAQLRTFAADVNAGTIDTDNQRYVLTADILLTGDFTPIGNDKHPFEGVFDGQGHVIYGLSVTDDTLSQPTTDRAFAGLFGYVYGADIMNVGVEGAVNAPSATYAGGLAGLTSGGAASGNVPEDMTRISGCYARVDVTAVGRVGGLLGHATRTSLADCYTAGSVTLAKGGAMAGGLVGYYQSASLSNTEAMAVTRCYTIATVHVLGEDAYAGSLFGQVSESYAKVTRSGEWSRATGMYVLGSALPAYYTENITDGPIATTSAADAIYERSASELKSASLLEELGSAFKADATAAARQLNGGYPLLSWQQVADDDRMITLKVTPASATVTMTDATTGAVIEEASKGQYPGTLWYFVNPLHGYTVSISAEGYEAQTLDIPASASDYSQTIELEPIEYSITYTLFGGTWAKGYTAPATYTVEDAVTLPAAADLSKEGFDFLGWKTSVMADDYVTDIPAGSMGNVTLFAWWQVQPDAPCTVSDEPFAANFYLVTYTGEAQEGNVPCILGEPLVWNGSAYVTLMPLEDAQALKYSDFSLVAGTPPQSMSLDLNGNGSVNIVDVQIAYDLACGVYEGFDALPVSAWLAADANGNGYLEASDALVIQRAVLGKQ